MRHLPTFLLAAALFAACRTAGPTGSGVLAPYFRYAAVPDTMRFEIFTEGEAPPAGDTIPNRVFFTAVDPALLREIDYLADSASAAVIARQRFPLDDKREAYWVDIRQNWFQHQSLFVYNTELGKFTGRVTVAEWYGGEGGQVLLGSWMFDFDGNGQKDLVRREIQHALLLDGDEARDTTSENAALLLYEGGRFLEMPERDSSGLVRKYPIRSPF